MELLLAENDIWTLITWFFHAGAEEKLSKPCQNPPVTAITQTTLWYSRQMLDTNLFVRADQSHFHHCFSWAQSQLSELNLWVIKAQLEGLIKWDRRVQQCGEEQTKKQEKKVRNIIYLIIQATTDISTIYGWNKSEVSPVFPLKIFIIQVTRCTVPVEGKEMTKHF